MNEDNKEDFLHRWSRRKHQAEKEKQLPAVEEKPLPELPPVDELTPASDYTGFMHPKVEQAVRRVALKKLFNDPHFNTPDPFEPFSGDWTVGEAIAPDMLARLNQAKTLLFPEEKKKEQEAQAAAEAAAATAKQEQEQEQEIAKPDEPGRQDA